MIKLKNIDPSLRWQLDAAAVAPLAHTAKRIFVDSNNGSDTNQGDTPSTAKATIASAVSAATASVGDVIYVMPRHAETVTAAIALSKAGISVIGLGSGSAKPTITGNFAGDPIDITAINVTFQNFHFAAPSTDEQTSFINFAAGSDGAVVRGITGIGSGSSLNVVDCFTIVAGAHDVTITDVDIFNTNTAVNSFLSVEGAVNNLTIKRFRAHGDVATAGIIDAAAVTNLCLEDVTILVKGSNKPAITLDSNPTGTAVRVYAKGTSTTLASNVDYGNAMALFEVRTAEDFNVNGAIIPAADTE
jgi:hypothetical protein